MKPNSLRHARSSKPNARAVPANKANFALSVVRDVTAADADEGIDVDMLRDTLAFRFGALAQQLLARTLSEPETMHRYKAWLTQAQPDCVDCDDDSEERLELACAGFKAGGQARVEARPAANEFFLRLTHPSFSATLSVAFSVAALDTLGVHLVNFDGQPIEALHWVRALCAAITRPTEPDLLN
jgi:hypothetical protein